MALATVYNPKTKERKQVTVGDANAFKGGFVLEQSAPKPPTYSDTINQAYVSPQKAAYDKAMQDLMKLQSQVPGYMENKSSELQQADPQLQNLIKQRGEFVSQLYSKPFQARESYKDIFDPVAREALVSQAVGNIMGQLSTTGDFITQRRGTADQQAQRALEALQSQIGLTETQAQLAKDEYDKSTADEQNLIDVAFNENTLMGGVLSPQQEQVLKNKGLLETWQGISSEARRQQQFGEQLDIAKLNDGGGGGNGGTEKYEVKRNYDRVTGKYTGLTFLNDAGEPVAPLEYAQATGKSLIDVLSGSGDPGDQAFIDAYNMEMEGVANGKTTEEAALANLQANFGHIFGVTSTPQQSKPNIIDILSKYNR